MRFLMLNWRDPDSPLAGGAERVSQAYMEALAARGHEVWWFAHAFPGGAPEERIGTIRVLRAGGKATAFLAARRWHRQQGRRFDLVIDQHHGIPWYAPWWCGTRCIAYIHEVLGPIWNAFYRWPLNVIGRWQETATHRLYARVPFWVPSESTRQTLLDTGVKAVTYLPNGVDTVPLAHLADKPMARPVKLCVVSRLAPNKRIDHAIRAVHELRRLGVDLRLTIVGGGEYVEKQLRELVQALSLPDLVLFKGRLGEEAKNVELQNSHLLLHASMREGWGLNVIEANAMGTPAVVYPVGGLVDSTVHEETGLITRAETPLAMAEAVQRLVLQPDLYARLRVKAWTRAKTFQWSEVLPKATEFLERMASGQPIH